MIDSFRGKYRFLSNFYSAPIEYEGIVYPTSENAYQAAKSENPSVWRAFASVSMSPGNAKKWGGWLTEAGFVRPDWHDVRLEIMLAILRVKFAIPELRDLLLGTGDEELVEGNTWGDKFWGVCDGEGENHLGKLLMQVRRELKST
jgi:ribA/ribD-fused uncharacterized protein